MKEFSIETPSVKALNRVKKSPEFSSLLPKEEDNDCIKVIVDPYGDLLWAINKKTWSYKISEFVSNELRSEISLNIQLCNPI